jgi:hypothetical protein
MRLQYHPPNPHNLARHRFDGLDQNYLTIIFSRYCAIVSRRKIIFQVFTYPVPGNPKNHEKIQGPIPLPAGDEEIIVIAKSFSRLRYFNES